MFHRCRRAAPSFFPTCRGCRRSAESRSGSLARARFLFLSGVSGNLRRERTAAPHVVWLRCLCFAPAYPHSSSFTLLRLSFSSREWLNIFFFKYNSHVAPVRKFFFSLQCPKMTIREFSNDLNVNFEGHTFLWGSPPRTFWPPVLGGCVWWLFCFVFHHTLKLVREVEPNKGQETPMKVRALNFHSVLKVQRTTERSHVAGTGWRGWGYA